MDKLLFDETPEYEELSDVDKKIEFKKRIGQLTKEELKLRIEHKIKQHKLLMSGGLDLKPTKKKRPKKKVDPVENTKYTPPKVAPKVVPKVAPKVVSRVVPKVAPKVAPKVHDGKSVTNKTAVTSSNANLLSYINNQEADPEFKKINEILKQNIGTTTELPTGYSRTKLQNNNLINKTHVDNFNLYNIKNKIKNRQHNVNPALTRNDVVRNFSTSINNEPVEDVCTIINKQIFTVLNWHEQRLNKFIENEKILNQTIGQLKNELDGIKKNMKNINSQKYYLDFTTLRLNDRKVRVIQSSWRYYKFKRSLFAVKIQRWYRYKKHVKDAADEVAIMVNNIINMQNEAAQIAEYLSSLNGKQKLPLQKLHLIREKIMNRQKSLKN